MLDKKYIDIKVVDGGWQIDAGQQPTQCSDLYSIAQDIKHSIMESGLARELIAERSPVLRSDVLIQIEQLAEQDFRIIPGTATAVEVSSDEITLTADTYEYGTDMSFPEVEVKIKKITLDTKTEETPPPFLAAHIGEIIITSEDKWQDSEGNEVYDLIIPIEGHTVIDETHLELFSVYGSTPPVIEDVDGSQLPSKLVVDNVTPPIGMIIASDKDKHYTDGVHDRDLPLWESVDSGNINYPARIVVEVGDVAPIPLPPFEYGTFPSAVTSPRGIAFDGTNLWVTDPNSASPTSDTLHKLNLDGTLVQSYNLTSTILGLSEAPTYITAVECYNDGLVMITGTTYADPEAFYFLDSDANYISHVPFTRAVAVSSDKRIETLTYSESDDRFYAVSRHVVDDISMMVFDSSGNLLSDTTLGNIGSGISDYNDDTLMLNNGPAFYKYNKQTLARETSGAPDMLLDNSLACYDSTIVGDTLIATTYSGNILFLNLTDGTGS